MRELSEFIVTNWTLSLPLLVVIIALCVIEFKTRRAGGTRLSPQQAVQFINQKNSLVIDLRSATAFKKGHIIKAKNFDATALRKNLIPIQRAKKSPILVVCDHGSHSSRFAHWLTRQDFENVCTLCHGIQQWQKDNLPLTTKI